MKVFKTVGFVAYMIGLMPRMVGMARNIERYRAQGDFENERVWIRKAEDFWGNTVCEHFGFEVVVEGETTLPEGPVLFVANHEAYVDIVIFMVGIKGKAMGFVAKSELEKLPWYGRWIARVRSIYIDRSDARSIVKLFDKGEQWIRDGFSMTIFPEGTRAKTGSMGSFKKGSLRMAFRTGVPIVPVTIKGTYALFEQTGYPSPGRVNFHVHPAVETAGLTKSEQGALIEEIEALIRDKLNDWEEAV